MTGKRGQAPCGHPGTHVTVNYVSCDQGCDAVPEHIDPEKTGKNERCPYCNSHDVATYVDNAFVGHAMHCWGCGRVW